MVAVLASEEQLKAAIKPYTQVVSIAAINAPKSVVISGEREAVMTVSNTLAQAGLKTKALVVSHAFHSPLMEPMQAEFEQLASEVSYAAPRIPLISNLTGEQAGDEIARTEYWLRHVRQPVRFLQGMKSLRQEGYDLFMEIGPQPTLLGLGRRCIPDKGRLWLPSLQPGQEDWSQLLYSLGELYVRGIDVDWASFDRGYARRKVVLPTYPFQRQRYWIASSKQPRRFLKATKRLDFLNQLETSPPEVQQQLLVTYLQEEVSQILEFDSSHKPEIHQSWTELGLDSLIGAELVNQIRSHLEISIPIGKFFETNNILNLVEMLLVELNWTKVKLSKTPLQNSDDAVEEIII
jgi:acyl transferase domain-containing protein